jgi:hypothetical protein
VSSFSWLFVIKFRYFFAFCRIYQLNQTSFTLFDILSASLINIPDLAGRINYEKGGKYIVSSLLLKIRNFLKMHTIVKGINNHALVIILNLTLSLTLNPILTLALILAITLKRNGLDVVWVLDTHEKRKD